MVPHTHRNAWDPSWEAAQANRRRPCPSHPSDNLNQLQHNGAWLSDARCLRHQQDQSWRCTTSFAIDVESPANFKNAIDLAVLTVRITTSRTSQFSSNHDYGLLLREVDRGSPVFFSPF